MPYLQIRVNIPIFSYTSANHRRYNIILIAYELLSCMHPDSFIESKKPMHTILEPDFRVARLLALHS